MVISGICCESVNVVYTVDNPTDLIIGRIVDGCVDVMFTHPQTYPQNTKLNKPHQYIYNTKKTTPNHKNPQTKPQHNNNQTIKKEFEEIG